MHQNRIEAFCERMMQDGYDLDSVETLRRRLLAEAPPHTCLLALEEYYRTGSKQWLTYEEISTTVLQQRMGMDYISAVATLLWLEQQPEKARAALAYYYDGFPEKGASDE